MVVRYKENGWEIITQRAHGIIAAKIAFNWSVKQQPERWVETILAIAEHDDAENELDGEQLLTGANGPLNYDMKNFDLAHCEKLVSLTITKSRYIALLTSMHMEFLYGGGKEKSKEAIDFLAKQKKQRSLWLKELKLTSAKASKIYDLVEWCDAVSLLICTEVIQPLERTVEIGRGPDKKLYNLKKIDEETLSVFPWPFENTSFDISYEYRLLDAVQFTSSSAMRAAYLEAAVLQKNWTFTKTNFVKATTTRSAGRKSKLTTPKS